MRIYRQLVAILLTVLATMEGFSQQLRLGINSAANIKSAVLELQSTNQGLLFTRIADTALINTLNPPDGMVVYFTPASCLLLRAGGVWQSLASTTSIDTTNIPGFYQKVRSLFSAGAGISYNGTTGVITATEAGTNWSLNGNTTGALKTFGTIDNYDLPVITANTERMRITGAGFVGIGTSAPSTTLHIRSGTANDAGLRLENLTNASSTTSGAAVLGVDANGKVVRAKTPVYYTGTGSSATVDGITKIWVAEVANVNGGVQTVSIPANVGFSSIVNIQVTAKGGSSITTAPIAMVTSNTTSAVVIRVLESATTGVLLGGTIEGLEAHNDTNTKIYIRVEGN